MTEFLLLLVLKWGYGSNTTVIAFPTQQECQQAAATIKKAWDSTTIWTFCVERTKQ